MVIDPGKEVRKPDDSYSFKGFLIGCVYTTILSLAIAGIDYVILHYVFWK